MQGLQQAIMRRPPRGNGTGERGENFTTPIVAASTTNVAVLPTGAPTSGGCWVTFKATVDCFIRWGRAASPTVAAATTSDYPLTADQEEEFWITFPDDANFSVIRETADGTLNRFRSDG
ncbi:MAG: hypothetical protein JXB36_02940 [Gammaproteobacteria bacterium]|nr:hypothetical protein [Gammaproteobacteria bacterium]